MFRVPIGAAALLAGLLWAGSVAADVIRIGSPRVDGVPVDWCRSFGQGCGWPAAHAFCRDRGYRHAAGYEVYTPGRTYMQGDDSFCTGLTCRAFLSVTCTLPPGMAAVAPPPPPPATAKPPVRPSRVRFDHPRNGGAPADACSLPGTDCGWGGAHKFCEYRGFDRAVAFSTYRPGASAVLGADGQCVGQRCLALRHVICEHQAVRDLPPAPPAGPSPGAPPPRYVPPGYSPPGDGPAGDRPPDGYEN